MYKKSTQFDVCRYFFTSIKDNCYKLMFKIVEMLASMGDTITYPTLLVFYILDLYDELLKFYDWIDEVCSRTM